MDMLDKTKVVAWNVGFIDQNVSSLLNGEPYRIQWMKHSYRDRFFADPFLLKEEHGLLYILAEEYLFSEAKGRIVELQVNKTTKVLQDKRRLLETQYHLSYPFIYNDKIYAEQYRSGKWISYGIDGTPVDIVAKIGLIDATIWNDGEKEWVFASKIITDKKDAIRKAFRYKLENGKVNEETEILVADSLNASRPGGHFFKINDTWYRPAQTSTERTYGESIAICKVTENTDVSYREEKMLDVHSHNEKRYNKGLHTFNPYDEFIIVDGFEMQPHPIQKIKYRLKHR